MNNKLIFQKIEKENIFQNGFFPKDENGKIRNNEIEFKNNSNNSPNIAILYGANGTGKTSLTKVFENEKKTKLEFNYIFSENNYNEKNNIFHIINDQSSRNIATIPANPKELDLGFNVEKERELEDERNKMFETLFQNTIQLSLTSKFGLNSQTDEKLTLITDEEIKEYVKNIINTRNKQEGSGKGINIDNFIKKIQNMKKKSIILAKEENYSSKLEYIKNNYSLVKNIKEINNEDISQNKEIKEIEENNVAVEIIKKFNYKKDCIVCDTKNIDKDNLVKSKQLNSERIKSSLSDNLKKILSNIVEKIEPNNPDPFNVSNTIIEAIEEGNKEKIKLMKEKITQYCEAYNDEIELLFIENLSKEIIDKNKEYNELVEGNPNIEDSELSLIQNFINENIDRKLCIIRNPNNKNLLVKLGNENLENIQGEKMPLSTGEQNFLSLTMEFLKAKKTEKKIIVLDDPISSFDSIYKNKISYCILKFLENKTLLILTHNIELIKLMAFQMENCFNLYLFNNIMNGENGFIKVNDKEKEILLNMRKLITLFRKEIFTDITNKENFYMSMIPFMRGYVNITDFRDSLTIKCKNCKKSLEGLEDKKITLVKINNILFNESIDTFKDIENNKTIIPNIYKKLSDIMHGYSSKNIDIVSIYNELFGTQENHKIFIDVDKIINTNIEKHQILKDTSEYGLLSNTLYHTFNYLKIRLKVEKELIKIYNLEFKSHYPSVGDIIRKAFEVKDSDSDEVKRQKNADRVFFTSRKTLLNDFNHFEGNMDIFQPAIDITDKALEEEKKKILEKLEELKVRKKI